MSSVRAMSFPRCAHVLSVLAAHTPSRFIENGKRTAWVSYTKTVDRTTAKRASRVFEVVTHTPVRAQRIRALLRSNLGSFRSLATQIETRYAR